MVKGAPLLDASQLNGRVYPLGLYVHIPFCVRKCGYCDFNSYPGLQELHEPYLSSLILELRQKTKALDRPSVDTIYIGGGTPTILPPQSIANLLLVVRECCDLDGDAEITVEANPGTVALESLSILHTHGVNRLSLGVQSLDDAELRLLGRIHNADEAREAVTTARRAGFTNLNLDLIYGLPRQSVAGWLNNLEAALDLEADHLSLYCLTLEEGTPLFDAVCLGDQPAPDPDLAAEMYERASELLASNGFVHYELSNWARRTGVATAGSVSGGPLSSRACRHNLKYWTGQPYLGIGAGAHSYMGRVRWHNLSDPRAFIDAINRDGSAVCDVERLTNEDLMAEAMFLGLRLVEGVRWDDLRVRLGSDPRQRYAQELSELVSLGLLQVDAESAKLTPRGQLLGNQVFVRFVPDRTEQE